ncbi:MAG: short chain dehydrogenase [Balneolaceae bacterium]|nr:short chain dehydrogenase [Balneolaceae bacterium]
MRIAVIGARGTIGKAVTNLLSGKGHEIIGASRSTQPGINIDDPVSISTFYNTVEELDGVICAAGNASFGGIRDLSDRQFQVGIKSKLMGQVNLVRYGISHLNDGGFFVLTSGMLSTRPWPNTSAVAMVNAGLEGFTRAVALDMPDEKRICIVSPPLIKETAEKMRKDSKPWPSADEVAQAYLEAVSGDTNGEVLYVDGYDVS